MLKWIILAVIFLYSIPLLAQPITGSIKDAQTNLPIPYASIGLKKSNTGTNAEGDGRFTLNIPAGAKDDSLVISCVGYKTIKLPVIVEQKQYGVLLERSEAVMKEVLIRKLAKKITLPWNKGRSNVAHTSSGSNTQFARLLIAPEKNSLLESVTIAIRRSGKARFRIRIYDYDSVKNQPGKDLCDSVLEVYTKGVFSVNLEKFNIIIPQKQFFVAVQWLIIEENKEYGKDEKGGISYTYRPSVRTKYIKEGKGNTWLQFPNEVWLQSDYDGSITATLQY